MSPRPLIMSRLRQYVTWLTLGAYFVCLDFLAPDLIQSGRAYRWWLILIGLLGLAYSISFPTSNIASQSESKNLRYFRVHTVTFLLLGMTLFLYDPSIRPRLSNVGLSWLWILSLLLTFFWLISSAVWIARRMKSSHRT
jgi:peptidoglycan/LPS O-acetylase OafA/YrhL